MLGAAAHDDFGLVEHVDLATDLVRLALDPIDEVLRHLLAEALAAYDHHDSPRKAGEIDGRLSRRVAGSYDINLLIPAVERLGRRRSVIHTATFELLHALGWQPLPGQSWCEDQRLARDLT